MQLGMIGLGRMGAGLARRLMRGGHECVVFDLDEKLVKRLTDEGAVGATSIDDLLTYLGEPRVVWVMVPAGATTEQVILALIPDMQEGDIIIDGGNSYYKDDLRRSRMLAESGIRYVDVGTSGGILGIDQGYCLMIGGEEETVGWLDPVFKTLAPGRGDLQPSSRRSRRGTAEEGYLHCGPAGAGHFVKMIHNGIEYGLMQSYAEGLDILHNADSKELPEEWRYNFNVADIAELWRRGSIVGSWLLDMISLALAEDPALSDYTGHVEDTGSVRQAVMAAIEEAVSADVVVSSLNARFRSRQEHTFAEKILSAVRHKFGGHIEPPP
jgi:6-phosphogluconate dehydrogenase